MSLNQPVIILHQRFLERDGSYATLFNLELPFIILFATCKAIHATRRILRTPDQSRAHLAIHVEPRSLNRIEAPTFSVRIQAMLIGALASSRRGDVSPIRSYGQTGSSPVFSLLMIGCAGEIGLCNHICPLASAEGGNNVNGPVPCVRGNGGIFGSAAGNCCARSASLPSSFAASNHRRVNSS